MLRLGPKSITIKRFLGTIVLVGRYICQDAIGQQTYGLYNAYYRIVAVTRIIAVTRIVAVSELLLFLQ